MKNATRYLFIITIMLLMGTPCLADEKTPPPDSAYNSGIDFYNQLDYNKAIDNFLKALNTEDGRLEQWTDYNLGNAHFKSGEQLEKTDVSAALDKYEDALEFYRRAIDIRPEDRDAKYNYEITAKKIKELEVKQQQQKQQQQQSQQQDRDQQQQQSQQQDKDQQQAQQPAGGEQPEQEQNETRQSSAREQAAERKPMSKEEALMLLENFQQSEKQQELLSGKEKRQYPSGGKNW